MKIIAKSGSYEIADDHHYAVTIEALAKLHKETKSTELDAKQPPERNDIKRLWRDLGPKHKRLVRKVRLHAGGISQGDLENALGVDWLGLRGIHNGLARICKRLGVDNPIRQTGYTSSNRSYFMDQDVAHTLRKLSIREKRQGQ